MWRTGETLFSCCVLLLIVGPAGAQITSIRLVNGQDVFEGRLEIFYDGVWGTVCDDGWIQNNAQVVCRQLGFSGVKDDGVMVHFGEGVGKIWLDDVSCSGTETELSRCQFPGWGNHNCGHSEDVGVRCLVGFPDATPQDKYLLQESSHWLERLGELFESGSDCDFNISVVVDGNPVNPICAHTLIVALNPNIRDTQKALVINTTPYCSQHARAFIRYFYTGEISLNQTDCVCLLEMASDWGLREFQNKTASIITSLFSQDHTFQTALSVYDYALSLLDEALMNILLQHLAWNFERLVSTTSWKSLPLDLVEALLARSDLVVSTETVVLLHLEEWATARGLTAIPPKLLKLVRFPMIPAKDLNLFNGSQYQAGRFQGFQFQALPYSPQSIWTETNTATNNSSTPRLYTNIPWSYKVSYYLIELLKKQSSLSTCSQRSISDTFDFHTPFHSSAHFTYTKANWKLSLNSSDDGFPNAPLAGEDLNFVLKLTMERGNPGDQLQRCIDFSNKLIVECEGRYTVRVDDFVEVGDGQFFRQSGQAGLTFPCTSNQLSYIVVIRSECRPLP